MLSAVPSAQSPTRSLTPFPEPQVKHCIEFSSPTVTDITEHPTAEGKVYRAAVLDDYSRLIASWSNAEHMRTELVTDALGMAIIRRRRPNHTPFRPRLPIHVLGVRATPARRRTTRLNGHRR